MPSAIVGAIAAVGASIGGAAGAFAIMYAEGIASALVIGGTLAASAVQGQQARAKAKAAYNASQRDREVMIRSAVAPRRIILGRDRVSGPIIYAQSTGTKGEYLHLVIALADGECDAIETIYFNDVALPDPDASGYITSGEFARTSTQQVGGSGYMTSAGGTLTLPQPATRITSVATTWTGIDGPPQTIITGWAHTSGSATITGLPASTQVDVTGERDVGETRVRIKKHLGQPGQVADADLVAESGGKWTAAHVGAGVCYLYVRLQYDPDIFGQTGVPNISCVIRGRKLYDPRTSTTAWSDNAALCAAFLLRAPEGFNAAAAEVPDAETIAGANICDETVALDGLGATQKRYICNASIVADVSPRDAMADVLSTMAGTAVWTQGRWLVRPGAYRTPTLTLTEDYLAGAGVSIIPKTSRSDLFNAVRATYRDPSQGWAEVQAPLVTNAGYESADGGVRIVRNIRIAGAMDAMRAQRLAKIELERERQALTVQLSTSLRGYNLSPTDTVALTLERYGFAGKSFEVRQRSWSAEGVLDYTLRETAAGVWAWNYGEATVGDLAPDTVLPSPYTRPAALAGLSVESGAAHALTMSDGTSVTRAWLQWTQSAEIFVLQGGRIDVQWQRAGASEWQTSPALPGDAINTYVQPMPTGQAVLFRVRAVNASGRTGTWSVVAAVVTGKPPAGNLVSTANWVIGSTGSQSGGGFTAWNLQATSAGGGNSIVLDTGPDGIKRPLWRASSGDALPAPAGEGGIASTSQIAVDTSKPYRAACWFQHAAGPMDGTLYLGCGPNTVDDIPGGSQELYPYFEIEPISGLVVGRWYLFVGHVLPASYSGAQLNQGGVYDGTTGARIANGTDFRWHAGVASTYITAIRWYTGGTGRVLLIGNNIRFEAVDGQEPSIAQLLADAIQAGTAAGLTDALADAAAAQAAADAANVALSGIASDNMLTKGEKPAVRLDWEIIADEQAGIDAQATAYGIAAEKTAYDNAVSTLAGYLTSLSPLWYDTTQDTPIVGSTFRAKFRDAYAARQTVLNKIAAVAKVLADSAKTTADSKAKTFFQASAPADVGVGNLWYDTDDGYKRYRADGSAWVAVPVGTGALETEAITTTAVYTDATGVFICPAC